MVADMAAADSPILATQIERDILSALCANEIPSADWSNLVKQLSGYEWKDPEHQVVYDALRGIQSRDLETRRRELPAQVTRMGFPDIDWGKYLDANALPGEPVQQLIDRLVFP
jgi:hypothetical protein